MGAHCASIISNDCVSEVLMWFNDVHSYIVMSHTTTIGEEHGGS